MKFLINCDASVLNRLFDELTEEWYGKGRMDDCWRWQFLPEDTQGIRAAMNFLDSHFDPKKDHHRCKFNAVCGKMEGFEARDFSRLSFCMVADRLIGADKTRPWDARKTCPSCGNINVDPDFLPKVNLGKMPKKSQFFSLDGNLKLFCREKFIRDYHEAGLTGLSFSPFYGDLFRVRIALHSWADRSGVCDECGMKTNVAGTNMFNLPENYPFDFQVARVNSVYVSPDPGPLATPSTFFVLSPVAMDLVRNYAEVAGQMKYCLPILPGYMADKIHPPDKLFRNGETPLGFFGE